MRFLIVFLFLTFLGLTSVSYAQSCLKRSSSKATFLFENNREQGRLKISSKELQCSNSLQIKPKNQKIGLNLKSGQYQISVAVNNCNLIRKKIAVKNKKTKIKFKLKCSKIIPRDSNLPGTTLEALSRKLGLKENSNLDLQTRVDTILFEEVFNQLSSPDLSNLLNIEQMLLEGSSIDSILRDREIDRERLSLNSGGLITASTSLLGPKRIQENNLSSNLNSAGAIYDQLRSRFNQDKIKFLLNLEFQTLKNIFLKSDIKLVSLDPIILVSNELIPFYLSGSSKNIVRRIALNLNFESGAKVDTWHIPTLVSVLRAIPPEKRAFFVTFTLGSAVMALDPLVDSEGVAIEKFPGVPYRFPSYNRWKDRVYSNLSSYLTDIKNELHRNNDFSTPAKFVAIDFESIGNDWESTVNYFQGRHSLLLQDPRTIELMNKLSLTESDIREMDTWVAADPRRLRWDAYMLSQRAKAISDGVGESFRDVFGSPDIIASNYDDTLRSNLVPNGAFERKEFRTWGSIGTSLNHTAPSIPLYGLQYQRLSTPEGEILSTPPAPAIIHEVTESEYHTRSNTFVSTLNRVNSISSATSLKTNHYVTFKEFIDTWHEGYYGPCMRYDSSLGKYYKDRCSESEGIGDFMFEYWALASQNSKFLNLYTISTNLLPITLDQAQYAKRAMDEINRLLGFSDRALAKDAFVYIDGVKSSVSANKAQYGKPFYVWAARANNKIVYRVVFMAPNGFNKNSTIIKDGSAGDGVQIMYGDSFLEIPGAIIDQQSANDSLAPYGFFITQDVNFNKLN